MCCASGIRDQRRGDGREKKVKDMMKKERQHECGPGAAGCAGKEDAKLLKLNQDKGNYDGKD